jgi:DNA-directed RNA polymerase II subunit RPB2
MTDNEKLVWVIIEKYFKDNPNYLVKHQIEPYENFFYKDFFNIIKEKNPIRITKNPDEKSGEYTYEINLYIGGRDASKIYYGKPIIFDDDNEKNYLYPNKARLNNNSYCFSIHYDVDIDYRYVNDEGEEKRMSKTLENIFMGKFPIMLQSNLCILKGLTREARYNMGECRNDYGGYFIIDGKEKVIISQEKFADNILYVRNKVNDQYSHSAEMRTVSEDSSKPARKLWVRIVASTPTLKNEQIVVNVPNVRKPVPLFILMRALGIISDKKIIEYCLLDKVENNSEILDIFRPSVHDALTFFSRKSALQYISTFTKNKTISEVLNILNNYFMPNIGEDNYNEKAYMLGYMVRRLLNVYLKIEKPTDRDSFKYKRIEVAGTLLYDLFKEYYGIQNDFVKKIIDEKHFYNKGIYSLNPERLILDTKIDAFDKNKILEVGVRKAFKGNWGAQTHTKRVGIVQDLERLSYNKFLSLLRKVNLSLDSSAKVVGPRLLNSTQWGIIDPIDTPDGGNIGLHKHMALITQITGNCSGEVIYNWIKELGLIKLDECNPELIVNNTKIFINGSFKGIIREAEEFIEIFYITRRNGIIPTMTSIQWNIEGREIFIASDAGRPTRPLFYINNDNKISYDNKDIIKKINEDKYNWNNLIVGFNNNIINNCEIKNDKIDEDKSGIIDYIDTAEAEWKLIAMENSDFKNTKYTHVEIHPSLCLGIMGNQSILPEHNQLPRNMFSCVQSRQAVSLYHSNHFNRMDKTGIILNYGETPLVKSRYDYFINKEEHPYGTNTIVAIMSYNGYNVEDAVLVNEGSLKRGLFRTTYYTTYQDTEEIDEATGFIKKKFSNIENEDNILKQKANYDYSNLDVNGICKENTKIDDKTILIGKINKDENIDESYGPKKGQLGYVDKTYITKMENNEKLAKIKIREERQPNIGDKICSRAGQKGTVGLIIPEEDMPFTSDGIKPDLIVNPHAIPSRMTISQLVECIMGKSCSLYGSWGDSTAFTNKGPITQKFGELLMKEGFHSSGNEIMYNGMTGEQLESEIFIGPTYYLRLKHMVKDKINYRSRGPKTMLTRQTVHGRANDGGLRIGEMERDGLIGHGMAGFLEESMMIRGDEYYLAICNKTGVISIYNKDKKLFMSPLADGPITFIGKDDKKIKNITKFGRNFSIIRIPYSFKLLMQELATMNVQMRIITENNVEQLTNLNYPAININNINFNEVTEDIQVKLNSLKESNALNKEDLINQDLDSDDDVLVDFSEEGNAPPLILRDELVEEEIDNENVEKVNEEGEKQNIQLEIKTQEGKHIPILEIKTTDANTSSVQNLENISKEEDEIKDEEDNKDEDADEVENKPLNIEEEIPKSELGLQVLDRYEIDKKKENEENIDEDNNEKKKIII